MTHRLPAIPCRRKGLLCLIPFVAVLAGVGCASTTNQPSTAQTESNPGYVTSGGEIVRSGSGGCVRTGSWEEKYAVKECDPQLVAEAPPPATQQPPEETASTPPADTAAAPPTGAPEATEAPQASQEETAAVQPEPEPAPQRIYLGADTYFSFDQAGLTDQGKRALDAIAERAKSAENELSIRIVGHADQIGSDDYNLSLSQRRADAVRTYLLDQGVADQALAVEAAGESDPIVTCEGRQGRSLIDCLQPNRRTEIEFSAMAMPQ